MSQHEADLNATTKSGLTPLLRAVEGGQLKIVELLFTKGVKPNKPQNTGITPLHAAVSEK